MKQTRRRGANKKQSRTRRQRRQRVGGGVWPFDVPVPEEKTVDAPTPEQKKGMFDNFPSLPSLPSLPSMTSIFSKNNEQPTTQAPAQNIGGKKSRRRRYKK
jgi:hypothetical protein